MAKAKAKRWITAAAAAAVSVLVFSGCTSASPDGSDSSDEKVTLRFTWWGSEARQQLTDAAIEVFEDENPNITVESEFSDWGSYWDKLTTSAAAGDLADVVTMTDPYMYSYVENNQLVDLKQYTDAVSFDEFSEATLANLAVDDKQYGAPAGVGSFAIAINPSLFEQAGIEIPDDDTWTWDDYQDIAVEISSKLPEVKGSGLFLLEQGLDVWLRQHGEDYWADGGDKIGFTAKTAEEWFEYLLELSESGGTTTIEQAVENASLAPEQTPLALGTEAMNIVAVGQLGTFEKSGQELQLLKFPGDTQFEEAGGWTVPGAWYSVSATSKHPEEAAKFIDFMVNSTEAGEIQKFDRGVPGNAAVLEAITPDLGTADQKVGEYVTAVQEQDTVPFARQNASGGPVLVDSVKRMSQEVLFGRMTPAQAAEQVLADVKAGM